MKEETLFKNYDLPERKEDKVMFCVKCGRQKEHYQGFFPSIETETYMHKERQVVAISDTNWCCEKCKTRTFRPDD